MRIVLVGAGGNVGRVAAAALNGRHEVIGLSRSTEPAIDLGEPGTIERALDDLGHIDALVVAAGSVPFKPLAELRRADYEAALGSKVLGQLEVVQRGLARLADHGSITLTTGIIGRAQIATGAAAALANGAVESFVRAAATELPRGIRINAVSPTVLANSPHYHEAFPGFLPAGDDMVGAAYVRSVEGVETGQIFAVE